MVVVAVRRELPAAEQLVGEMVAMEVGKDRAAKGADWEVHPVWVAMVEEMEAVVMGEADTVAEDLVAVVE